MTKTKLNIKEWYWVLLFWRRTLSPCRMIRDLRQSFSAWRQFWGSYRSYINMTLPDTKRNGLLENLYPCVYDATNDTPIEPTYFYQDAWAFEHIVRERPSWHVDIGSHHKFVALLSKVLPVTMVDIRPLSLPLATLNFREGSILELPYDDDSVPSVSSLCVVEHIGLGRYGDQLDPDGTEKAIAELKRIVAPGGNLYLSVPVDDENRTYFNAHRAFSEFYLRSQFAPFEIVETRYVYGNEFGEKARNGFGIACFWLKKPKK